MEHFGVQGTTSTRGRTAIAIPTSQWSAECSLPDGRKTKITICDSKERGDPDLKLDRLESAMDASPLTSLRKSRRLINATLGMIASRSPWRSTGHGGLFARGRRTHCYSALSRGLPSPGEDGINYLILQLICVGALSFRQDMSPIPDKTPVMESQRNSRGRDLRTGNSSLLGVVHEPSSIDPNSHTQLSMR